MKIDVYHGDFAKKTTDVCILTHWEGLKRFQGTTAIADKDLQGAISEMAERKGFSAKLGETMLMTTPTRKAREVLLLGVGEKKVLDLDRLRLLGAHAVKAAETAKAKSVLFPLDLQSDVKLSLRDIVQALVEGMRLATYHFHTYHGTQSKNESGASCVQSVVFTAQREKDAKLIEAAIASATVLTDAVHLVRDLVNTPSADMTPQILASAAESLAERGSGITCKTLSAAQMERLGMHAALAVARGSVHPPVGIHLTYTPQGKSKKTVAIVGKAVTFDSGGLSIKPAKGMETMKIDMAGAATVIGLFHALRTLRPNVTVHGIFLAVENMVSGSAYRPGDVVKAMDGTTIEILNTDAEGRVTLADALCYAVKQSPDMIVDLATLTGACIVALGDEMTALLSNDDRLAKRLLSAAEETGEPAWELPLYQPYAKLMKSKIADLRNISVSMGGGVITAALFLKPFVQNISWAHLDIAGPSYVERVTRPDIPYGGTGHGVRMLAKFLERL